MLGIATSTVDGRLRITFSPGFGSQAATTASQTSLAKSSSVAVKVSGLYSRTNSVSGCSAASCLTRVTLATARALTSSLLIPNTVSRNTGEVAL